jgi:hypothetical protein
MPRQAIFSLDDGRTATPRLGAPDADVLRWCCLMVSFRLGTKEASFVIEMLGEKRAMCIYEKQE